MLNKYIFCQRYILGERDRIIDNIDTVPDYSGEKSIMNVIISNEEDKDSEFTRVMFKRVSLARPSDVFVVYKHDGDNVVRRFGLNHFNVESYKNNIAYIVSSYIDIPRLSPKDMLTFVTINNSEFTRYNEALVNAESDKRNFFKKLYLKIKYRKFFISENNVDVIYVDRYAENNPNLFTLYRKGSRSTYIYTIEDLLTIQNYFYRFGIAKIFDPNNNLKILLPNQLSVNDIFEFIDYKLNNVDLGGDV